MKNLICFFAGALAFSTALGQIINYSKDNDFESVPKKSTNKQNVDAGDWLVHDNAVFAYNPTQPNGYTTPYGSKFVYFANSAVGDTDGEVGQTITVPKNTNLSIHYDYRVFKNANPDCGLAVTFNTEVVDTFILPTGKLKWTFRATPNFQSSSTTGVFAFEIGCEQTSKFEPWRFGLDNVLVLYEGCPACG